MDYYSRIEKQGYYLIAEIGVNYYDIAEIMNITLLDAAKLMIKEAKTSGADAVKFQTYTAKGLASKNSPSYWDKKEVPLDSQYEFFKLYENLGKEDYQQLCAYAKQINIDFLSTPFDFDAADYLENMMAIYKISSSDLTNHPFIEYIAKKNKPVILSVGASNEDEIEASVELIQKNNKHKLTLLHCVLEYPTLYEHANLKRILALKEKFPNCIIGYSDHTKPDEDMCVVKTAYCFGAKVIEKHFTLDKSIKGKNDHFHSMDSKDLRMIKDGLDFINRISGSVELNCLETERTARLNARRSLVAEHGIACGELITRDMITFKRPGTGIPPYEINSIIGKKAKQDIAEDTTLQYEMFC